ncbi:uncharacterized protein LOC144625562 [Crassostrea virginica]
MKRRQRGGLEAAFSSGPRLCSPRLRRKDCRLPTKKRDDINCCVRKLMALPVSPEEDILPAFERISATIHVQPKIFRLWGAYSEGELSTSTLLKKFGRIYCPN